MKKIYHYILKKYRKHKKTDYETISKCTFSRRIVAGYDEDY